MSDRDATVTVAMPPSGAPGTFAWSWSGTPIPVTYELSGPAGAEPVLLLPAMSTVSTRDELSGLARRLGRHRVVVSDWPGFGDTASPAIDYDAALGRGFLHALVDHLEVEFGRTAFPVVACGHAAGYAIDLAARRPGTFSRLVLIAPTWRGPLPTMMNGRRPVQGVIRRLIQAPVVGELLYRLNVSRPVVRMMYRRHVFADPAFLTDDLLAKRMRFARRPGARFASACFVTGALDPFEDRAAFLAAAERIDAPILVLYGRDTPPRSHAEMQALVALPGIESQRLDHGTLGMAEEHPAELAPLIEEFLSGAAPALLPHDRGPSVSEQPQDVHK
jgi:pimeloyl-ACP methyl ester carboxylesterase